MTGKDSATPSDSASVGSPPLPSATDAADSSAVDGGASVATQSASTAPASAAQEGGASEQRDWAWGAIVVIAGLLSIVAVFVFAVFQYTTAAEVTTAVGAVSGVIAALVGAYFGIRGATLAQANSESSSGTPPKTKT